MTPVDDWVVKAEGDYRMAVALNLRHKQPLPDGICFHCQQCADKYLKAYLVSKGMTPPRIHDLPDLLSLCRVYDATFAALAPDARLLNQYAVDVCYPGVTATIVEAADALKTLRRLRRVLRRKLEL